MSPTRAGRQSPVLVGTPPGYGHVPMDNGVRNAPTTQNAYEEVELLDSSAPDNELPTDISLQCNLPALAVYGWYHGQITKDDAISLLQNRQPGSFLVRDSSQQGCFAISLKHSAGNVAHILACPCDANGQHVSSNAVGYIFGKSDTNVYQSIPHIVTYYKTADNAQLTYPVDRT